MNEDLSPEFWLRFQRTELELAKIQRVVKDLQRRLERIDHQLPMPLVTAYLPRECLRQVQPTQCTKID